MGKRSPGPMSYIREASALRNIKLCYAGRSFSIRVVIRCLPKSRGSRPFIYFQYVSLLTAYTTKGPDPNRNWLGPGPFLCVARW